MNNQSPAAQASDEPMRAAFEAHVRRMDPKRLIIHRFEDGEYMHLSVEQQWQGWQAALADMPSATADVERDAARWRFRQNFLQNGGAIVWTLTRCRLRRSGELVSEGANEEAAIDAAIAATTPGEPHA